MTTLDVWKCGNCGGNVSAEVVARGAGFCGFCGAAISAPVVSNEPVTYEVRLEHAGATPIPVIKVLAEQMTLSMGRELVNKAPTVVMSGASQERAEQLREKLVGAGARAVVIRSGGSAPSAVVRPPAVADPIVLGGMWYAETEVEARRPADGSVLASAKVATSQLELRIPTGGAATPVALSIRRGDELPMVIHFNHPLTCSRNLGDPMPLPRQLYEAMARITKTPIQPGTGILALRARHDESTPDLAGVSFSVSPAGLRLVYVDERGGYSGEQGVTSKWGAAFALNVQPGRYHVTASAGGSTWLPATVHVVPDIVTELQMWR